MKITLSVDAMGGDYGLEVTIPATLECLENNLDLSVILVGDENLIKHYLASVKNNCQQRVSIQHASQCVDMDESPSKALRNKKDSSMRVAINLLHEGKVDACISAGNTGALMATAKFVLKMINSEYLTQKEEDVNGNGFVSNWKPERNLETNDIKLVKSVEIPATKKRFEIEKHLLIKNTDYDIVFESEGAGKQFGSKNDYYYIRNKNCKSIDENVQLKNTLFMILNLNKNSLIKFEKNTGESIIYIIQEKLL